MENRTPTSTTKQTYATVDREFFQGLAQMMKEHGVTVPRAKDFIEPTEEELKKAEEILSGAPSEDLDPKNREDLGTLLSHRRREVTSIDALKRHLVKPDPKSDLSKGFALDAPSSCVVKLKESGPESIFYARALTKIVAFDVRSFLGNHDCEAPSRVPSITCEANSLLLFRINGKGETKLEVVPQNKADAVISLLKAKAIDAAPYCPPRELELHPALDWARQRRQKEDSTSDYNKVLKAYGVSKAAAAEHIAKGAKAVLFRTKSGDVSIKFPRVTEKSVLRVLNGKLRMGDELRKSFIEAFCEGFLSHHIIYLRESSELISRNEFKVRFPGIKISDKHLRTPLAKRERLQAEKEAAESLRKERKQIAAARREKREEKSAEHGLTIQTVGPIIHRAFSSGVFIENVASYLTDQGFHTLNGDLVWSTHNVRAVYKQWQESNGANVSPLCDEVKRSVDIKPHPTPKPPLKEYEIRKSALRVFTELATRSYCSEAPRDAIKFQGILELVDRESGQPIRVGVYLFTKNVRFMTDPDGDGRCAIEARVPEGAVAVTRRRGGQVSFTLVSQEAGKAFLDRVSYLKKRSERPAPLLL